MIATTGVPAVLTSLETSWPADREALARFDHAAHVQLARRYILELPLPVAVGAFARDLEAMTGRFGASAKFHRTITLAWMLVVADRVLRSHPMQTWQEFSLANPDLLHSGVDTVRRLYRAATLASPDAREHYLVPDALRSEAS